MRGVVTETRHQGFVAYLGELPVITERDKVALIEELRTQARAARAAAKAARVAATGR